MWNNVFIAEPCRYVWDLDYWALKLSPNVNFGFINQGLVQKRTARLNNHGNNHSCSLDLNYYYSRKKITPNRLIYNISHSPTDAKQNVVYFILNTIYKGTECYIIYLLSAKQDTKLLDHSSANTCMNLNSVFWLGMTDFPIGNVTCQTPVGAAYCNSWLDTCH